METLPVEIICAIGELLKDKNARQFSHTATRYYEALSERVWRHPRLVVLFSDVLTKLECYPIKHLETDYFCFVDLEVFLRIKTLQILEINHLFGAVSIEDLLRLRGVSFKVVLHSKTLREDINVQELGGVLRQLNVVVKINHTTITGRLWFCEELAQLFGVKIDLLYMGSVSTQDYGKLAEIIELLRPKEVVMKYPTNSKVRLSQQNLMKISKSVDNFSISSMYFFRLETFNFENFRNLREFTLFGRDIVDLSWLRRADFKSICIFNDSYCKMTYRTVIGEKEDIIKALIPNYLRKLCGQKYILQAPISLNISGCHQDKGLVIYV